MSRVRRQQPGNRFGKPSMRIDALVAIVLGRESETRNPPDAKTRHRSDHLPPTLGTASEEETI